MIKNKKAVNYFDNWTVEGSKAKGKKMTNDNITQILKSFNNEFEASINKIKNNNIQWLEKRITKSFEQPNQLNKSNKLSITTDYLNLKIKELFLAFEYERKKQDEKKELKVQREREREDKALQKEIANQKKIIEKDITHYKNLIDELRNKLNFTSSSEEKNSLENQI